MLCEARGGISKGLNISLNALGLYYTVFMLMTYWFKRSDTRIKPGHHSNGKQTLTCWTCPFWADCNSTASLLSPNVFCLCRGLGPHEALALPSCIKCCPLSTCSWTHKPCFKCRLCIDYALVHHCLNLYKVLIWASILIFLILSEHLAMTLLSREGLLSLACSREVDIQRYSSTRLWPQKLSMAKCCWRFPNSVSFSSGCVSYRREGCSERACRENYVDQNVAIVSMLFCPHLHDITVPQPCKPFPQCNVPLGLLSWRDLAAVLLIWRPTCGLSVGHWHYRGVRCAPSSVSVPPEERCWNSAV